MTSFENIPLHQENDLNILCKTLYNVTGISLLYIDRNRNVLSSYSKWENHIKNFFVMNCPYDLPSINSRKPMYYSDSLYLNWLIIPIPLKKTFFVMGPVFETDVTPSLFQKEMDFRNMSVSSQIHFLKIVNDIPVIPNLQFFQYMSMIYYGIYGIVPSKNDVFYHADSFPADEGKAMKKDTYNSPKSHGSMLPEKLMLEGVRTGNIHLFSESNMDSSSIVGILSNGEPLRQAKNAIIVQIALVTRAAVEGGMNAEAAYSLSDFYIQKIELCVTSDKVYALSKEMYQTFVQQVHEIQTTNYSSHVKYICAYIDKHIHEEICLEAIADELGYDTYYLTTLFKKDTGKLIKTYILEKKVEQAKILLSSTLMETQEISQLLSFKSSSYFCTQFKKITGESPLSYRKRVHPPV